MGFIESFYYGNINPQDRNVKNNADYKQSFDKLCENEQMLRERLTGSEKAIFLDYVNEWGLICSDLELCSYIDGFRHGARCALDICT